LNSGSGQSCGAVIVLSGPSGVGKSTICKQILERVENVYLSISTTTRMKKIGEQDGVDYFFVSRDEFEKQKKAGNFLEYAEVFGNFYGTPRDKLEKALNEGKTVLLEIDVQGAQQVKKIIPDARMIFILPPEHKELKNRITGRGRDDEQDVKKRLAGADAEIAASEFFDYKVVNDKLENAVEEVLQIIKKEIGE